MKKTATCKHAYAQKFCHYLLGFSAVALCLTAVPANAEGLHLKNINNYVHWVANYTGEAGEVVRGGIDKSGAYAAQLLLGGDVDMNKAVGWKGAKIVVRVDERAGNSLSEKAIGNSTSVQEIYGSENIRLMKFTIEQTLMNGRLTLKGGRTFANPVFANTEACSYFQNNATCGSPTFVYQNSGFTWWPAASWGFHAKAWLTDKIYVHAGVFEVNPRRQQSTDNGLNWGIHGATGVNVPVTIDYKTTFKNDRLPRMYEIGGYYDSSRYSDPLLDDEGEAAALSGNDYAKHNGRSAMWVRFNQMVWRPDNTSERGLSVFGAVMNNLSGRAVESNFQMIGFLLKGTFPSRPHDTLAFVVDRQGYSGIEMKNIKYLRAQAGGSQPLHDDQYMMELSYGFNLTEDIHFLPNIQYVIHPDQMNDKSRVKNVRNALVLGFRFDVNFDHAFGFNR